MSKKVSAYSQPAERFAEKLKGGFSQNKIKFAERNIVADKTALAEVLDSLDDRATGSKNELQGGDVGCAT